MGSHRVLSETDRVLGKKEKFYTKQIICALFFCAVQERIVSVEHDEIRPSSSLSGARS